MTLEEILARLANPQAPGGSPPVPPAPTLGSTEANLGPLALALTPPPASRALMEPDLLTQMQGGYTQVQLPPGAVLGEGGQVFDAGGAPWPITRRPNVLPFTVDAENGRLVWAMPRIAELVGALQGGPVAQGMGLMPKVGPGEQMLGTFGKGQTFDTKALDHAWKLYDEGKISPQEYDAVLKKVYGEDFWNGENLWKEEAAAAIPEPDPFQQQPWTIHDTIKGMDPAQAIEHAKMAALNGDIDWGTFNKIATEQEKKLLGPPAPTQAEKDLTTLFGSTEKAYQRYGDLMVQASTLQNKMNSPNWSPGDMLKYKDLKSEMQEIKNLLDNVPSPVPGKDAAPGSSFSAPKYEPYENRRRRLLYEDTFIGPPDPRRELPMDPESMAERASRLGFDERTYYTGMPTLSEAQPRGFADPLLGKDERGIFLSDLPQVAESYAGAQGAVFPTKIRFGNTMDLEWADAFEAYHGARSRSYDPDVMSKLIDTAIEQGFDSLKLRNMYDVGVSHPQNQFVVLNPNQLRSPWARFDPMLKESADLTSGIIPPGLLMDLLAPEGRRQR